MPRTDSMPDDVGLVILAETITSAMGNCSPPACFAPSYLHIEEEAIENLTYSIKARLIPNRQSPEERQRTLGPVSGTGGKA